MRKLQQDTLKSVFKKSGPSLQFRFIQRGPLVLAFPLKSRYLIVDMIHINIISIWLFLRQKTIFVIFYFGIISQNLALEKYFDNSDIISVKIWMPSLDIREKPASFSAEFIFFSDQLTKHFLQ